MLFELNERNAMWIKKSNHVYLGYTFDSNLNSNWAVINVKMDQWVNVVILVKSNMRFRSISNFGNLAWLFYFRPNGMTHADERFSARWKERCARFLGCIESAKLIAGRTKQRQEKAQIERLKKERAEMEKYRQRFLVFWAFFHCLFWDYFIQAKRRFF